MCCKAPLIVHVSEPPQAKKFFTYTPQEAGMVIHYHAMAITGKPPHPSSASHCTKFVQGLIFLFITVEFGFYILIRQMVNAKEWLSACPCSSVAIVVIHSRGHRAGTQGGVETATTERADVPGAPNGTSSLHCAFGSWNILGMEGHCPCLGRIPKLR